MCIRDRSIATMQMFMQFERTVASTRDLAVVHGSSIACMDRRLREVEQVRESLTATDREVHTLARTMADRTFRAIEEIESRFTRFNDRVITLERVCFDEPAATRRRMSPPTPSPSPVVTGSEATGEGEGIGDLLQRALNAMPAAVAEEVARLRRNMTDGDAVPIPTPVVTGSEATGVGIGSSLGHSLEGAINGDRLEQFFVKTLTGETLTIRMNGRENTTTLLTKIQAKFPLRAGEEIRLIYEGRQLTENYVNIRVGTTVHMLMRLRGGMRAASSSDMDLEEDNKL